MLSEETPAPCDPLLSYKKPQLGEHFRALQQLIGELQQQLAATVDAGMKREARIAELEARLALLEPYRAFIEQWHDQMHREEQGPFSSFPGA